MLSCAQLPNGNQFALPNAKGAPWEGACLLLGLYLGSLLFAGVVAPWVYQAVKTWHALYPGELNTYLLKKGFSVYVDRLRWLPIVCLFPRLLKKVGLNTLQSLGLWQPPFFRQIVPVFILGVVLVSFVGFVQIINRIVGWDSQQTFALLAFAALKAFVGAVILSVLEEVVFRGLALRAFYTVMRPWVAIILSALFFAYLHFKAPKAVAEALQTPTLGDGLTVAFQMFIGPFLTAQWLPFLNLWALGIALNVLYLRTGSLLACVSLHCGLVWAMLFYKRLVETHDGASSLLWGTAQGINGLFSLVLISLLMLGFLYTKTRPLHNA